MTILFPILFSLFVMAVTPPWSLDMYDPQCVEKVEKTLKAIGPTIDVMAERRAKVEDNCPKLK